MTRRKTCFQRKMRGAVGRDGDAERLVGGEEEWDGFSSSSVSVSVPAGLLSRCVELSMLTVTIGRFVFFFINSTSTTPTPANPMPNPVTPLFPSLTS